MVLWTLIKNLDTYEHDAIPNTWLISKDKCWYPDKSKSTATKLAKESAAVIKEDEWLQLRIDIVKKDFDSFERCMGDAIRKDKGKRTFTSSENEGRGRGLRAKYPVCHSDQSCESTGDESSPKKKKSKRATSPQTPIKEPQSRKPIKRAQSPMLNFPSHTETPTKVPTKSPHKHLPRVPLLMKNNVVPAKQSSCRLKKPHICSFKMGPITMETIGHSLCALSRSITILRNALEETHQNVVSRLDTPGTSQKTFATSSDHKDDEDDFSEFLSIFPLNTVDAFQEFNDRLKDSEYRKQIMKALMTIATKTSCSRAVTSILRFVLHGNCVENFSWKGQERWKKKKVAFADTLFSKALVDQIKQRWPQEERKKIEQAVSSWLTQTPAKLKKKEEERSTEKKSGEE